jgi:hypothetical protein
MDVYRGHKSWQNGTGTRDTGEGTHSVACSEHG